MVRFFVSMNLLSALLPEVFARETVFFANHASSQSDERRGAYLKLAKHYAETFPNRAVVILQSGCRDRALVEEVLHIEFVHI